MQYFRGVDGDYRCPECPDRKDLGSTVELLKHVWLHRASEPDARIEFPYKGGYVIHRAHEYFLGLSDVQGPSCVLS